MASAICLRLLIDWVRDAAWRTRCAVRVTVASCLFAFASSAQAQIVNGHQWPTPRLNVLTPTGGKLGTTLEVTFAGTECEEPTGLLFSHPGIKGAPIIPPLPPVD